MYSSGWEQQHGSTQHPQRVPDVDHPSSHFNVTPIPYYTLYSFPSLSISTHFPSTGARKFLATFYNLSTIKILSCREAPAKWCTTINRLTYWDKDPTVARNLSPFPSCHLTSAMQWLFC